jgi:hypothetical protein
MPEGDTGDLDEPRADVVYVEHGAFLYFESGIQLRLTGFLRLNLNSVLFRALNPNQPRESNVLPESGVLLERSLTLRTCRDVFAQLHGELLAR